MEERFISNVKKVVVPVIRGSSGSSALSAVGDGDSAAVKKPAVSDQNICIEGEVEALSKAFSLQRFDVGDIDANDEGPFMVRDYIKDISEYLFRLEVSHL